MSRKPEQLVYDTMKRTMPLGVWLERIENGVGEGMPDVNVYSHGHIKKVELKYAIEPKRATTAVMGKRGLRDSQVSWHRKAASMNLPTYILVRTDQMRLFLIHSEHGWWVNDMTMQQLRENSLAETWPSIWGILTR